MVFGRVIQLPKFASITLVAILISLWSIAPVSADTPARAGALAEGTLVEAGVFTFGVALTGTPFTYKQDGALRGFEFDLARAVAAVLGLELRLLQLPRKGLLEALAAGRVDAINTLALPDVPAELRSLAYLSVGDHMMVLRENPFGIETPMDLAGQTVSVTAGTDAEDFARAIAERLRVSGRKAMDLHSFPEQRFTSFPVSMGHAAAYFVKTVSAVAITLDPEATARLVPGVFQPARQVGFGLRAGDQDLFHALEQALTAVVADGQYRRLRQDYGLPEELSPFH